MQRKWSLLNYSQTNGPTTLLTFNCRQPAYIENELLLLVHPTIICFLEIAGSKWASFGGSLGVLIVHTDNILATLLNVFDVAVHF